MSTIGHHLRRKLPTDTTGSAVTVRECRLVDVYIVGLTGRLDVPLRVSVNGSPIGRGDIIPPGADVYVESEQAGVVGYPPVLLVEDT